MSARPVSDHLALGREGEDAAADYLEEKSHVLLARNWSQRGFELDIITRDRGTIVFVEVKTRAGTVRGTPEESVTPAKRRKIAEAAARWLSATDNWDQPCRFDVVSIVQTEHGLELTHHENAFDLSDLACNGNTSRRRNTTWQPW